VVLVPDATVTSVLIQAGFGGLVLLLFVRGWLAAKPALDQKDREIEYLRTSLEGEKAAHADTRAANVELAKSAMTAVAATETMTQILVEIRDRQRPGAPA
jgi:uncharacterized protein YggE